MSESSIDGELPFDPPIAPMIELDGLAQLVAPPMRRRTDDRSLSAIDGVAITTVNPVSGRAHLLYVSESLAAMLGCRPDQLLGSSPNTLFSDNTPAAQLDAVAAVVDRGQQAVVRLDLRHENGADVPVEATFLALPPLLSDTPYYLALYRDVADMPRPEQLLADHGDLLDALAHTHDLHDVFLQVSERVEDTVRGSTCWIGVADHYGDIETVVSSSHRDDLVAAVIEMVTESGNASTFSRFWAEDLSLELGMELQAHGVHALWSFPVFGRDHRSQGLMIIAHDERSTPHPSEQQMLEHLSRVIAVAIDRSLAEATLAHQTLHDSLTQLPNRALIIDRLEQAVARLGRDNTRLGVLLVDLDRFKNLNDTRGADAGDEVLIEVSRRLRRSVRLGDTVGRIGGDQFLVVCVAMNGESDASSMAERIVTSLDEPIKLSDGSELTASASIGVALIDEPGQTPSSIISSTESALEKAIELGRGGWAMFEEGLQRRIVVRHEVEQALQLAISDDELVLHYQPFVEIATGRMTGAEALIRWNRPGHGLLPPASFIEIAEDTGLILPVGEWVIDETCRQLATWPVGPDGQRPTISVNLSAKQLAQESLVSTVISALDRHGVPADRLGFEVTESMRVEDVEAAISTLRRLAALGCKLAIDDFGIGYATLDYLRRFSMADTIKIDRSFVSGLGSSREDTAIVSASVALARSLGLAVVAEGVETLDQYQRLAELGCEHAQGYLLSRPVPLEQALQLWDRSILVTV